MYFFKYVNILKHKKLVLLMLILIKIHFPFPLTSTQKWLNFFNLASTLLVIAEVTNFVLFPCPFKKVFHSQNAMKGFRVFFLFLVIRLKLFVYIKSEVQCSSVNDGLRKRWLMVKELSKLLNVCNQMHNKVHDKKADKCAR